MNRPLARVSTPQLTWALLDGAREPFFSIVLSIVFPPYFVATIAADPVTGTAQWGYMLATSAVILVILAPVAGVVVNASERPRTWIAALVLIAAFSLLGLWPGTHGKSTPILVLVLCVTAYVSIELTRVFTDSLVTKVAQSDEIARMSGIAVGVGFASTFLFLAVIALASQTSLPSTLSGGIERASTAATGIWLFVLVLPFLFCFPHTQKSDVLKRTEPPTTFANGNPPVFSGDQKWKTVMRPSPTSALA